MKKILVPTDFSANADRAMEYALEIAKRTDAEVHAFHVIFPNQGVHSSADFAPWIDEYISQRRKDTNLWAMGYKKKAKFKEVSISSHAAMGFPIPLIIETAEDKNFDLIVMGTMGATGLLGSIMGSVAAGVLGRTTVPVLTIPPKAKFRASRPFVFATDFRAELNTKGLKTLQNVMELHRPKVKVLHVQTKIKDKPTPQMEAAFSEKLKGIRSEFHYLTDKNVIQATSNFIEATDAAGLITIGHNHTFFYRLFNESMSHSLAAELHVPVLVLHDAKIGESVPA